MAVRWTPPYSSRPTLVEPPPLASADRERRLRDLGVPQDLLALLDHPEHTWGHALRPDPQTVTPFEQQYRALALFATNEFQDLFLMRTETGAWIEIQIEDGVHAEHDSLALALASRVIEAYEHEVPAEDCVAFARRLGLRQPEALVAAIASSSRPTFQADEAWRRTVLPGLI
jgi:hypothetical protein